MNWPHLHLLLNHAPLFGTIIATVMLAVALTRRPALARPALYLLVLSGFVAVLVYLTGEPAADALGNAAPDALVDPHEEMAGIATIVTGLAAIGAITVLGDASGVTVVRAAGTAACLCLADRGVR